MTSKSPWKKTAVCVCALETQPKTELEYPLKTFGGNSNNVHVFSFWLSSEAIEPFLVNLGCVCHQNKSKMQAAATLLAHTDPRGDKYVCLLICASVTVGKRATAQTAK